MFHGPSLAHFHTMTELEFELYKIMVKLVVRYPDGWDRIESALQSVYEAGLEMQEELKEDSIDLIH